MTKKVLLAGGNSINNFGDLALNRLWIEKYQSHNIKVYSKPLSLLQDPNNIDVIHFTGGGYINDILNPRHIDSLQHAIDIKKNNKHIKIFITGIGLFPLSDRKDRVLNILDNFDLVDTRDTFSYEVCKDRLGEKCFFTGDDVFLGNLPVYMSPDNIDAFIVCLQRDFFKENHYLPFFISSIDKILHNSKANKFSKLILCQCMNADLSSNEDIETIAKKYNLKTENYSQRQTKTQGFPIGRFLLTSRYHPHIVSYMCGSDGIALYNCDYYKNKHTEVLNMGSDWVITQTINSNILSSRKPHSASQRKTNLHNLISKKDFIVEKILDYVKFGVLQN